MTNLLDFSKIRYDREPWLKFGESDENPASLFGGITFLLFRPMKLTLQFHPFSIIKGPWEESVVVTTEALSPHTPSRP